MSFSIHSKTLLSVTAFMMVSFLGSPVFGMEFFPTGGGSKIQKVGKNSAATQATNFNTGHSSGLQFFGLKSQPAPSSAAKKSAKMPTSGPSKIISTGSTDGLRFFPMGGK